MNIYILDPQFRRIGICDEYKSFIWTPRYFEYGDFELYAPANSRLIGLLVRNNLICREDDPTHAMFIERVEVVTDAENGNTIRATGRCLKSLLSRRVIWKQTITTGTIAFCISKLLSENIINPADTNRKVEGLSIGTMEGSTGQMSAQYTGDNLGEVIIGICRNYGLGFDIVIENGGLVFKVYQGKDRSFNQSQNPFVVFSPEYENLISTTYIEDAQIYANIARIGGEGEGNARKFETAGDLEAAGFDRYEIFVDDRDASSNDGEITAEEYAEMLIEDGRKELAEHEATAEFEGSTQSGKHYQLGVDFFLGDIVEVVNEYGIEGRSRITAIIECQDETGRHMVPTFESIYTETEYWTDEEGNIISDELNQRFIFK